MLILVTAAIDTAPTLDREVFEGLREQFGGEVLVSLVGNFCERETLVDELVRASRRESTLGDDRRLSRMAHRMRAIASVFAATRLAELCAELEARARPSDHRDRVGLADEIAREFALAKSEMNAALQPPPSGLAVNRRRFRAR